MSCTIHRKFSVAGLRSIYCAETLRIALNGIPGVSSYVSYKKALAEVDAPADLPVATLQRTAERKGYCLRALTDASVNRKCGT